MPECSQACQTDVPVIAVQGGTVGVGLLEGCQLVPFLIGDGRCVKEAGNTAEEGL